jgi:hypothetical protein
VVDNPLVIGESPRDIVPIVGPWVLLETCRNADLLAGEADKGDVVELRAIGRMAQHGLDDGLAD